jgi:hypothetical protein
MSAIMKERKSVNRMWLTVSDRHRRAFEMEAAARGMTPGELLQYVVETYLPGALEYIKHAEVKPDEPRRPKK